MPETVTGVVDGVVVPLPSCPDPFEPQQNTWLALRAQARVPVTISEGSPLIVNGFMNVVAVLPPQHWSAPLALVAHDPLNDTGTYPSACEPSDW